MRGIYLDDYRKPYKSILDNEIIEWDIVRSYGEFVSLIEKDGIPDLISFDHDLADEHTQHFLEQAGRPQYLVTIDYSKLERTGYHCAQWLCNHCMENNLKLPKILVVHSRNPAGGDNIVAYLRNYCKIRVENPKIYKTYW